MVIANPPTRDQAKQSAYRGIFVKDSSKSKCLHAKDIWDKIQQQSQMYREGTRFVLRQFLKENVFQVRRSMHTQQTMHAMKNEQTNFKQEINRQKEAAESYKQQLLAAGQKIEEKDRQLAQFRKMFNSRTPQSPSGTNTTHALTKPRRVSDQGMTAVSRPGSSLSSPSGSNRYHHSQQQQQQQQRRVSDQYQHRQQQQQQQQQQYSRGAPYQSSSQTTHRPNTPVPHQQVAHRSHTTQVGNTQSRSRNPYEQQLGGGRRIPPQKPCFIGNNANQYMATSSRLQHSQSQKFHNNNNNSAQQFYQHQQMGTSRPQSTVGMGARQVQQSMSRRHNSNNSGSGGSVESHSTASSGAGRILKITATSDYSFSGAAVATGGPPGKKRSLSPNNNPYGASKGFKSYTHAPRGPPSNYRQHY